MGRRGEGELRRIRADLGRIRELVGAAGGEAKLRRWVRYQVQLGNEEIVWGAQKGGVDGVDKVDGVDRRAMARKSLREFTGKG